MNLKEEIKENIYLAKWVDAYRGRSFERERTLRKFIRKMSQIDSIRDIELFRQTIAELKSRNYEYNCASTRYEDANWYGYYQALQRYAGYPERAYPILTEIEHGIRFGEALWPYFDYNACYICEGDERIHEIPDADPLMPVMAVGPYIHYAEQYYSEERIQEERKKNGKTLLVFPGHSIEWEKTRENAFIDILYERYAKDYQTVMVCSYWRDLDSLEVQKFRERGARIVSAGFRGDNQFVRRLKTIISLADLAVGNDIGTNLGFCLYLKKPYVLEGACQIDPDDGLFTEYYRELYEAFSLQGKVTFTEEQIRKQQDIYERFWGESLIKSPEEIYQIFSLIDKLIRKGKWNPGRMKALIRAETESGERWLAPEEHTLLMRMLPGIKGARD